MHVAVDFSGSISFLSTTKEKKKMCGVLNVS
jgi:hypothetical protein